MGLKVVTPGIAVFTTPDIRLELRLPATGPDDTLIMRKLASAQDFAEHYTGRAIGTQTLEYAADNFPVAGIDLPRGPASVITSIKYIDISGVEQTLSSSLYVLDEYNQFKSTIYPKTGASWPATDGSLNSVKILYTAGYAIDKVPPAVQSALLLIVADHYENREDSATVELHSIPNGARALLDTVRIWSM